MPNGERMQIHAAQVVEGQIVTEGQVAEQNKSIFVGTQSGLIKLVRIQLPGGRPIEGDAIVQKLQMYVGNRVS